MDIPAVKNHATGEQ